MVKKIHDSIIDHYSTLHRKYGTSPKALGWTKKRQSIRFKIMSQIGIKNGDSILDVGSGFGDLYGYLKFERMEIKYHGVDINEKFVKISQKRYPDALFEVRNIQTEEIKKKYDWVIGTGLTNHATNYSYIKKLLTQMFKICKKGVAMDFISNYVDFKDETIFYSSPEKIFELAKKLTNRVELRHDYMPFEFSIYLFKKDSKNKKNIFADYYNELPTNQRNDLWLKK